MSDEYYFLTEDDFDSENQFRAYLFTIILGIVNEEIEEGPTYEHLLDWFDNGPDTVEEAIKIAEKLLGVSSSSSLPH